MHPRNVNLTMDWEWKWKSFRVKGLLFGLVLRPSRGQRRSLCLMHEPGLLTWHLATNPLMSASSIINPTSTSPDDHLECVLRSQGGLQLPHLLDAMHSPSDLSFLTWRVKAAPRLSGKAGRSFRYARAAEGCIIVQGI